MANYTIVSLPTEMMGEIQEVIKGRCYRSRTEWIKETIRLRLEQTKPLEKVAV